MFWIFAKLQDSTVACVLTICSLIIVNIAVKLQNGQTYTHSNYLCSTVMHNNLLDVIHSVNRFVCRIIVCTTGIRIFNLCRIS